MSTPLAERGGSSAIVGFDQADFIRKLVFHLLVPTQWALMGRPSLCASEINFVA
jgi:hypothetical protein